MTRADAFLRIDCWSSAPGVMADGLHLTARGGTIFMWARHSNPDNSCV